MKKFNYIRKQQLKVYIQTILGFAGLFLALGFIIFTLFQNTTLASVDASLDRQVAAVKMQAQSNINSTFQIKIHSSIPGQDEDKNRQPEPPKSKIPDAPFKTNVLLFDKNGKLLNKDTLGNRYTSFKKIKPTKENINVKRTISVKKMRFRSYLIKVSNDAPNTEYAGKYVYVLQNIDTENDAIANFIHVLIISFVIFWLLSLILAYFLTRQSMKPVLKSWNQQTTFVNDAAHELRTPLSIIQSKLELLLTKPNDTIIDQAEPISVSLSEITRLTSLTDDLLTLARSDTNNDLLNIERIIPKELLSTTIDTFTEVATSQDKQLIADLDVNSAISVDPGKLTQVLVILLDNSLKYTGKDTNIRIHDYIESNKYFLTVANNGPSISNTDKKEIFNRFYRVHKDRSRQTGGNGLGLAIAKEIVTAHKGKISVSDNQPQGVIFKIELPVNGK